MKEKNNMDIKTESLVLLMEECGEVIQAVSKWLRWGPESNYNGRYKHTNKEQLIIEMGDVMTLISCVCDINHLDIDDVRNAAADKLERLKKNSNLFAKEEEK
jgi:NTP pyrophosphatase (non-canonical NTP hydrolase)